MTQPSRRPFRVVLVNPSELAPMKKPHARKALHAKKHAKKNPANPKRRARRHVARKNPTHRRSARRNPAMTQGKTGALALGAVAGVASELIDYGTDQIGSTPMVQGAVAVGAHAAVAGVAAFLDTRLLAAMTACGIKTASQRVRTGMALAKAKAAGDAAKKPAVPAPAKKEALDAGGTPLGLGAVSVESRQLPPAMRAASLRSVVKARSVNG